MAHITDPEDFCGVNIQREVFVETGTFQAITLKHMQCYPFKRLHTIDIDPERSDYARVHFRANPKIHVHCGNGPDVLREIIDPSWDVVFWLDSHFEDSAPILDELRAVFAVEWKRWPLVLVDDMDFMRSKGWAKPKDIYKCFPKGYTLEERGPILFGFPPQK